VLFGADRREFSHELIAAVSALAPMDLDAALERFTVSRLICQRATPPDATYSFKHALVQDAAHRHAAALALQHRQSAGRAVRMIDNDSA
jgi:predicted ATPase